MAQAQIKKNVKVNLFENIPVSAFKTQLENAKKTLQEMGDKEEFYENKNKEIEILTTDINKLTLLIKDFKIKSTDIKKIKKLNYHIESIENSIKELKGQGKSQKRSKKIETYQNDIKELEQEIHKIKSRKNSEFKSLENMEVKLEEMEIKLKELKRQVAPYNRIQDVIFNLTESMKKEKAGK